MDAEQYQRILDLRDAEIEQLQGVLKFEYDRHLKDANLANFVNCGCDFCVRVRSNQ